MKVIKLKEIFAYVLYSNLKRVAPKDFSDVEEMTTTVDDILPAIAASVHKFIDFRKQADDVNNKLALHEIDESAAKEQMEELQKTVRKYELNEGEQIVEVTFENAAFAKFTEQFNRWGKNWVQNIEDYVAIKKALDSATSPS